MSISNGLYAAIAASVLLHGAASVYANDHIIQSGLIDWYNAAKTGRSELLIISDSVGGAWNKGISQALDNRVGVVATGMDGTDNLWGLFDHTPNNGNWSMLAADTPVQWGGWSRSPATSVKDNARGLGIFAAPSDILDYDSNLEWHFWVGGGSEQGTLGAYRRYNVAPYPRLQTSDIQTVNANLNAPQHLSFNFEADPLLPSLPHMFQVENANDVSILYSRMMQADANGTGVSLIAHGGHSAYDLYHRLFSPNNSEGWSSEDRSSYYNALMEESNGKLVVMIPLGFNDQHEDNPSINLGIQEGNSPEAFKDNIVALIQAVRSDFTNSGRSIDDLEFVTFQMYDWGYGYETLEQYGQVMRELAEVDESISFINLRSLGPDFSQGQSQGFYADNVHLADPGAFYYGEQIIATIESVPEPASLALLIFGGLALIRRNG